MATGKTYNSFSEELKRVFGCKVQRISVDAGFTCPNRDGWLGSNGCVFCGGQGSGSHGIRRELDIAGQLEDGKQVMRRKYRAQRFLAYFQSYTNTYASPERLSTIYKEALDVQDVVGLIAATRPDCLPDNVLDFLAEVDRRTYFWLELGMQSMHDRTLQLLNRCHDHACSRSAIERARLRGLRVCAHVIIGLPGESRADLLETIDELNRLEVRGIKLHLLHVMKDTRLAEMYRSGSIEVLEQHEYVGLVCDALERLDPRILVHRLTGDGGRDHLLAPLWSLKKFEVLNAIDAEMARRNSFQGAKFS